MMLRSFSHFEPEDDINDLRVLYSVARRGRYQIGETYEMGAFVDHLHNDDPQLLREEILESVRAEEFPEHPSRLDAFFAWKAIAAADQWLSEYEDPTTHCIYVICPVPESILFEGDFGWLTLNAASLEEWEDRSFRYWSGESRFAEAKWEVVVGGPIAVVAEVAQAAGR
jgi:hypothetical protein